MFCLKAIPWSFLNEVRLFVHVLPKADNLLKSFDIPSPLENIYVDLDHHKLEYLNVTLGPKCTEEDRILVEDILSNSGLNPESRIKESELRACF